MGPTSVPKMFPPSAWCHVVPTLDTITLVESLRQAHFTFGFWLWLVTLSFLSLLVNLKGPRAVPCGTHWGVCVSAWTLLWQSRAMWIPGITWFSDRRIIWLARVSLCSGARCKCSYLERNVKWRAEMQGHCTRTQGSLALCFQRLLIIIKRHSQMDWERLLKAIEKRWAFKRVYDSWCPSVLMIKVGSLWGPVMWTIYIFISLLSGATGEQIHG